MKAEKKNNPSGSTEPVHITPISLIVSQLSVLVLLIPLVAGTISCSSGSERSAGVNSGIAVSEENLSYWEYNGKKTLLLGGSVEDNLFQIPDIEEHLDLLRSAGGNYVRNTMSSRDTGNVWAFKQMENGLYDLEHWNDEYWRRFDKLITEAAKRDIVVQIEIWATFDYYKDDFGRKNWDINPFNPLNNINYDLRISKLPGTIDTHPVYTENNFFRSVPSQMSIERVLRYQQKFVDKILSYTLQHDNVLYCMDNETAVSSDWGKFWAGYVRKQASLAGKKVYTTQMWNPADLNHPFHSETFDNPDIFNFVDISQNNHQSGDVHWENGLAQIKRLEQSGNLRPVNNVKIYGHDEGLWKTTRDAIENFIKNLFMGCASSRFHRPPAGQGLNGTAQAVIRSMRDLSERMDFFNGVPDNSILSSREPGEAYCRVVNRKEYAVYFPDGGSVQIDFGHFRRDPVVHWLDVTGSEWHSPERISRGKTEIRAPGEGHWIALIK